MQKEFCYSIPGLRREMAIDIASDSQANILELLTESDLINIYAEWLSKNKLSDRATQNGFIFEVISRRYLEIYDPTPKTLQSSKEVLMFLLDGENQRHIWHEEKSTPDDLVLGYTSHTLEIEKLIECKISAHAAKSSFHQKESTKNTVRDLLIVLSGNYQEVKSPEGKKLVTHAREKLRKICSLPVSLSSSYKYIYVLPSDQFYTSNNPKDTNLEVINLPFSSYDVDEFRELFFTNLARVNL